MLLQTKTVRQGINKAFLKVNVRRDDLDAFKREATAYLNNLGHAEGESEEHLKGYLKDFLQNTFYTKEEKLVNTSNRIDLGIYSGKSKSSTLEVLIEAKRPSNTREMITTSNANAKALHEAVLYYFEERENGNDDLKHIVITNYTEFFIFDAQEIERNFYSNRKLLNTFRQWKADKKVSSNTDFMYSKFSEFMSSSDTNLNGVYLDLAKKRELLGAPSSEESDKKLIPLFKLFSPEHLLKKSFANDSNSLDSRFYIEFLHILGLKEVKENGVRLIKRFPEDERQAGSLMESTISTLKYGQHMNEVREAKVHYGNSEEEQLFGVALELVITWMNRILFLKLMEAQLLAYHNHDEKFKFLSFSSIDEYDELNKLFFWVLALRNNERPILIQEQYGHIPYLNSSLFDATGLEKKTFQISGLDDKGVMELHSRSILKKELNPTKGSINTLEYLLRFLEAFSFSAESSGGIQTEDKTLINASVLGLIFEKINGYKDGSFFTPGYITEYMAKETLRKSVLDKLNHKFGWKCEKFADLQRFIESKTLYELNEVVNSVTVCDPAVGSGHFLVSCLNELISIKSDLKILCDQYGKRIPYLDIEVENDELTIEHEGEFFEYKLIHSWENGKVIRKPAGKERQRLQEALFHEKKFIIENCLFGVDINPNSVKICRLRLWIELLKNAYYRQEDSYIDLEVLPNIDINIKQGNSLVSRFELDEDLSSIFKKSKHSLQDYKQAVRKYKETRDRNEKQRLQHLIDDIKAEYSESLLNNKPINKKLSQARGKLDLMMNEDLFGQGKATKKEMKEQEKKVKILEVQKAEEEAGAVYNEAFEWRFEFPEVLDENGKYLGFDVVIGNPPYVRVDDIDKKIREFFKTEYVSASGKYDLYYLFYENGTKFLKENGTLSFITPNRFTSTDSGANLRQHIINSYEHFKINSVSTLNIFQNASTYPAVIFLYRKGKIFEFCLLKESKSLDEITEESFPIVLDKNKVKLLPNLTLPLNSDPRILEIYFKLQGSKRLKDLMIIQEGLRINNKYQKKKGEHHIVKQYQFKRYSNIEEGDYIQSDELNEALSVNTSRYKNCLKDKILISEDGLRVEATLDTSKSICQGGIYFATLIEDKSIDLNFILGVLNSTFLSVMYGNLFSGMHMGGGYLRYRSSFLYELPFVCNKAIESEISKKVIQILTFKNKKPEVDTIKLESEIDQLVYKLYGLNEKEIGIVEGDFNV